MTRACGNRIAGGVYLEVGVGPKGHPIEEFICDPPRPVDEAALGMSARGMSAVDIAERTYVFDHVGSDYPNAADIIEEGKHQGFSRRVQRNFDFAKLDPTSRLALVHPRAIADHRAVLEMVEPSKVDGSKNPADCPQDIGFAHCGKLPTGHEQPSQINGTQMCARMWWQDLDPDREKPQELRQTSAGRWVERQLGDTRYHAMARPLMSKHEPSWRAGIILILPIHQIVVVRDPEGGTHRPALDALDSVHLPVELVDE